MRPGRRPVLVAALALVVAGLAACQPAGPLQSCPHTARAKTTMLYTGGPPWGVTVAEVRHEVRWTSDGRGSAFCFGVAVRGLAATGQAYAGGFPGTYAVVDGAPTLARSHQEPVSVYSLLRGRFEWVDAMAGEAGEVALATSVHVSRTMTNPTIHHDWDDLDPLVPFGGRFRLSYWGTSD